MRKFYISFLMILFGLNLLAQENKFEGRLLDLEGMGIPNAAISIFGSDQGGVTDTKGRYHLFAEGTALKVELSCMGYESQRAILSLGQNEDITLNPDYMTLNEVVLTSVSATGSGQGISNIPGAATYLSPQELKKFAYTDPGQIFRTVPGVVVQDEDGFGLRPNIGLRGTGSNRSAKITIMEDGVLSAPAPYAAPSAYYFPTIGRMNAVEVLKGSSQIKYGPYTTGGAINLISTPIPLDFTGQASLNYGSWNSTKAHFNIGESHKHIAYMVEGFHLSSDGFKELDNGGNTGFNKQDVLAKFRVNSDASKEGVYHALTFKMGYAREESNETYLGLTRDDFEDTPYRRYAASQEDHMSWQHKQLSADYLLKINDRLRFNITAYHNEFDRNWYKLDKVEGNSIANVLDNPEDYATSYAILTGANSQDDDLRVKANNRAYTSEGIQFNANYNFTTGAVKHNIDFGYRLHRDEMDRYQWADYYKMEEGQMMMTSKGQPGTESNRIETAEARASYIEYELEYGKFKLLPGLRHEHITIARDDFGKSDPERSGSDLSSRSNTVDVWIPGVGAIYNVNKYWNIFAGVHRGFAPPGSKDGVDPELSINYELGARYSAFAWNVEATLFYNDYTNLLGSDTQSSGGTGNGDLYNGGEATIYGLELMAGYNLLFDKSSDYRLPLQVGYTYNYGQFDNSFESDNEDWGDVEAGDELPYLPNHMLNLKAGIEHESFGVYLIGNYNSDLRTVAGQGEINPEESVGSFFIMDVAANYQASKHINFNLRVANMLNNKYEVAARPAGLRPGAPINVNFGVTAQF